ncbi:hypothetical protein EW026_g863 [Hermanssonia centrifuga]|uniref:AMP-dependent synthetase/ligase domain-containing protein n=1 Tax=Hermanssonia centrifuga TaxID=98765 RepID=A0A4S4KTA5_9APHY|nr:hypothetical protein EW026_g863 [Hermanssonia centrifuga]
MNPNIHDLALQDLSSHDASLFFRFGFGRRESPPFQCVHHAFEYHASQTPLAIAVEHLADTISYAELDRKANALAVQLRAMGVRPGSRVCLLVQRSIPMVIGIMAVLKAGAAYVPLDGGIVTQSTLDFVIKNSRSVIVLSLSEYVNRVNIVPVVDLEALIDSCNGHHEKLQDLSSPDDSAYIIYTSGTTGTPKGVETQVVCLEPGNVEMKPGRRVSQLLNIAFDMAAWETLGSLANGCTLCIRGKTSKEWRLVLQTVDIVIATPSIIASHDPSDYPNIKVLATAALADRWATTGHYYNSCGPTEITIVNTVQRHVAGQPLSIGTPTPNNNVYILDEEMRPVPIGQPGVMWAGGAGISKGYVDLPDKTAERYKPDPFTRDGSYMFNTGDLGKWRSDGTLEHLGRIDDQVKVKGFRVELDGVSAAMQTCLVVDSAVALLIDAELWGFVTPVSADIELVIEATKKVQPYYAVPTQWVTLAELPHTTNGKIDKRALRQVAFAQLESAKMAAAAKASEKLALVKPEFYDTNLYSNCFSTPAIPPPVYQTEPSGSEKKLAFDQLAVTEKQVYPWDGYQEDEVPDKTQGKIVRNLRHQIFSLYRRLFGVVFVTNVAILIATFARPGGADAQHLGLIVVANLFLHSGCAISGLLWLIAFTAQATKEFIRKEKTSIGTIAVTYFILVLLIGIVLFAYPKNRSVHHDAFERTHRFLGWAATGLVILLTNDYRLPGQTLGQALIQSPPLWLVTIMTCSIILPWVRLRKVNVRSEVLSKHAVRLHFDYVTPKPGHFVRISADPLFEWHGFACIPVPKQKGFSLVVSKAGDWTSNKITEPPSKLWVRGVPCFGVLRITPLFRRVVFVATGSGIGPCAPCIFEQRIPIRLLWTSPNVRQTFGDDFVDSILKASPGAVVYDTRKHGKPDMVKLTYRLVKEFDAEAVCIISNQKLTQKVVYGMMSRGIPAFGAIWDS